MELKNSLYKRRKTISNSISILSAAYQSLIHLTCQALSSTPLFNNHHKLNIHVQLSLAYK